MTTRHDDALPTWMETGEFDAGAPPVAPESARSAADRGLLESLADGDYDAEELSALMSDVEQTIADSEPVDVVRGGHASMPSESTQESPAAANGGLRRADPRNWWVRTPSEIVVFFAVIVGIEYLLRDGVVGGLGIQPHPYWLLIVTLAAARGAIAALIAGTIAAALYAVGVIQTTELERWVDVFDLDYMQEPALFLAVGFVVGEIRDTLAARHDELCAKFEVLVEQRDRMLDEKKLLARVNGELKRRLFDNSTQFGNLITALTRGESSTDTSAYELALEMVVEHCGAARCSILLVLEEWTLDLAGHRGWEQGNVRRRLDEALTCEQVQRAIQDAERVSCLSPGERSAWLGPLVVAPIADSNGVVMALLCLDEVPVSRLNESTVATFYGIADWLTARLKQIARAGKSIDARQALASVMRSGPWLGTVEDLGARLRLEDARCSRDGIHTSLVAVQAGEFSADAPDVRAGLDDFFRQVFARDLRLSDTMFSFGYLGCYVIVLSGTTPDGAEVVCRRLGERLAGLVTDEPRDIRVRAFAPSEATPSLAGLLGPIAEHFRARSIVPLQRECPVQMPDHAVIGDLVAFELRMRLEIVLARRYGKELSLIDIRTGDLQEGARTVTRHIADGRGLLRGTDGIYVIGVDRCAVVMPSTSCDFAFMLWQRLTDYLAQRLPESRFAKVQMEVMALDLDEADETLGRLVRSHMDLREEA